MSAYNQKLIINTDSSEESLLVAREILVKNAGVVLVENAVFENAVALRLKGGNLRCEVIDTELSVHRCENEYEVMVENARRMLETSRLNDYLPDIPRDWLVVEGRGTRIEELWHAP